MKVPSNYSEQDVLDIFDRIAGRLAHKFRFGYHDIEDMKQQAIIFAIEALERYDNSRPLENFLWIHVRNRLFNYKRNNYGRPDPPCKKCPLNAYIDGECVAFSDMMDCEFYSRWQERNTTKKTLMQTKESHDLYSRDNADTLDSSELFRRIDKAMPVSLREDWIRFTHGAKLLKAKRELILETIREILNADNA